MISIIICTYNREKYIYQCLCNLAVNSTQRSWEIILINNNSTDNTYVECERFVKAFPNVNFYYFIETTPGLSSARNRGMREAHGDWFVFLDDDSMVENNYIDNLADWLEIYPNAGAFGGAIEPFFEEESPTWLSKWSMGFVSAIDFGNKVKLFSKDKYPIGANMGISRKVIEQIGFFNTALGRTKDLLLGGEEKDIFMRIYQANIPIYYFPNIKVKHCIPARRTTIDFIAKLGYGVGVSERLRTQGLGKNTYVNRIIQEVIKWGGTIILWIIYALSFQSPKGNILIIFRKNVTIGLLGRSSVSIR